MSVSLSQNVPGDRPVPRLVALAIFAVSPLIAYCGQGEPAPAEPAEPATACESTHVVLPRAAFDTPGPLVCDMQPGQRLSYYVANSGHQTDSFVAECNDWGGVPMPTPTGPFYCVAMDF